MKEVIHGIVLRTVKYSDTRWIVDLYSKEYGRQSVWCTLGNGKKGGIARNLLQPLSLITGDCDMRPKTEIHKLCSLNLAYPYISMSTRYEKLSMSLFLSDFLCHALRESGKDEKLFGFLESSLKWLDASENGFANFHLFLMLQLLRPLGFFPNVENYTDGAVFDLRSGAFSSVATEHSDYIPSHEARHLMMLIRMNLSTLHLFQMPHDSRNRITDYLLYFYRLHVPGFPELKSIDIVRQLFA